MAPKPAAWYLNAARRTVRAALPGLARPDDEWARARLGRAEHAVFARLPAQERAHGVEVAKRVLRLRPDADAELVAAALLHDVGKLGTPNGVVVRVLTHLLPPARTLAEPRQRGLAGGRQARVHHAEYGAEMLARAGSSPRIVHLVRYHHSPGDEPDLVLLRESDERT